MLIFYSMPVIFLLGILLIAFEDVLKVNKAAVSVGMCLLLWILLITHSTGVFLENPPEHLANYIKGFPELAAMSDTQKATMWIGARLIEDLGDVSTTLFFVLASMAIIEVLDAHGSFKVITSSIKTRSKRSLVWIFSGITFFLSALLGNLATVIVMVAVLRKIIPDRNDRLLFSCLTILAANGGGSWSPIGDVTTLLLWTGGNISVGHQIGNLILPAMAMVALPAVIVMLMFKKGETVSETVIEEDAGYPSYVTQSFRKTLLIVGLLSLAMVPVLQAGFNIPPYMGVLLGLVILWVITDVKAAASNDEKAGGLKVSRLFSHLDLSTIFFFLGILMSVKALQEVGSLAMLSNGLNAAFSNTNVIAFILGVCSSFLDNVALVAATMGMYPIQATGDFMANSSFWTFLAYCAVTGGSILIIGSASGVTVMGLEKIEFGYYLKKMTPLAILGYVAGAAVFIYLMA